MTVPEKIIINSVESSEENNYKFYYEFGDKGYGFWSNETYKAGDVLKYIKMGK